MNTDIAVDGGIKARRKILAEVMAEFSVARCVIVTSTFRSGSSFICSMLHRNGFPNIGKEFFSAVKVTRAPIPDEEYRAKLRRAFETTRNGLFVTKLMWPHRNGLARSLGYGRDRATEFAGIFPDAKWINIVRKDKFAQAISFWKAQKTDRWHVYAKEDEPEIEYDFQEIRKAYVQLCTHDQLWADFYDQTGLDCQSVVYEDFAADPDARLPAMIQGLASHNPPPETIVAASRLKVQRNEQSQEYLDKFLADLYRR